jgi:hypothetical protein
MTTVESALRRIVADLEQAGCDFALVGGLAVSARVEPRFTRDADLVVSVPDDAAAERVLRDLVRRGYLLVATVEHDVANRMATARLASPVAPDEEPSRVTVAVRGRLRPLPARERADPSHRAGVGGLRRMRHHRSSRPAALVFRTGRQERARRSRVMCNRESVAGSLVHDLIAHSKISRRARKVLATVASASARWYQAGVPRGGRRGCCRHCVGAGRL